MLRPLFTAKLGDSIFDTQTKEIGMVIKTGQAGNYDVIYVDFNGKTRKIIPMDDMQRFGRYQIV